MQSNNLAFVIDQAQDDRQTHPIALAVRASIEVGVVVPSILRVKLAEAGFAVVEDDASLADYGFKSTKHLRRVLVNDGDGQLVAMGASADHADALLHAMLGWFRENPLPDADVPEGIATAPGSPLN
jgi:hypothetical protein